MRQYAFRRTHNQYSNIARGEVPFFPVFDVSDLHCISWFYHAAFVGLSAPKGTPLAVIAKLNKALNESLKSAAVRDRLELFGMTIPTAPNTADDYGKYMVQEAAYQADLAKLTGHALKK